MQLKDSLEMFSARKSSMNSRHGGLPTTLVARCFGCKAVLTSKDAAAGDLIKTDKALYHRSHFRCTSCSTLLSGQGYTEDMGHIVCGDCFRLKNNPICTDCGHYVDDEAVELFGKIYHKDCVKCCACLNPLNNSCYIELKEARGNKRVIDQDCYYAAKYKLVQ